MSNTRQARSFIGEMREAMHHFYATTIRGEVSDANIQGYLRAASQIEDIWQQVDDRVVELISQGVEPWKAYEQMRYPLAFIRAARTYQVFVRELLAADAANDPQTVGYLPHITYDQANALSHQIQPCLQNAIAALHNVPTGAEAALPLVLGPRIDVEGQPCPPAHLQGMIAAAREVREWAAGLIAQYDHAVSQSTVAVPAQISTHITELQGRLQQADYQLRFSTDLVGQVTQHGATPELHEEAENSLWDTLQSFFLINQAVAIPGLLHARPQLPGGLQQQGPRKMYRDQRIRPADLWRVAAPSARSELRGTPFGNDEMNELCARMGGILSAGAQQYLDEVEAASRRGDVQIIAAMANCPFEPLYRARRDLDIANTHIPASYEFHWNFHLGRLESAQRFGRINSWQECAE